MLVLAALSALTLALSAPHAVAASPQAAAAARSTDVRKEATKAGFGKIAGRPEKASRPTAIVESGGTGASRLGGDPALPRDVEWPRCKGKPQTFLASIRLAEVPVEELSRHGGTLLFFTHVEFEEGETEYGLWAGECTTVLHVPDGTPTRAAHVTVGAMALKATPVRFTARPDIPGLADGDHLFPPLQSVKVADWERYYKLQERLRGQPDDWHRMLGYHDQPNGGDVCSARAERTRSPWRHLMTFDYDEDLGFMVADGGRLQVLISPADLRDGRFSRACGVFDSF
jgi:hypothetical protein